MHTSTHVHIDAFHIELESRNSTRGRPRGGAEIGVPGGVASGQWRRLIAGSLLVTSGPRTVTVVEIQNRKKSADRDKNAERSREGSDIVDGKHRCERERKRKREGDRKTAGVSSTTPSSHSRFSSVKAPTIRALLIPVRGSIRARARACMYYRVCIFYLVSVSAGV